MVVVVVVGDGLPHPVGDGQHLLPVGVVQAVGPPHPHPPQAETGRQAELARQTLGVVVPELERLASVRVLGNEMVFI